MSKHDLPLPHLVRLPRREFLKLFGVGAIGAGVLGGVFVACGADDSEDGSDADAGWVAAYPVSEGYLLVDVQKCQGCVSCMLACAMVNEGVASLSLARLQVVQNSFVNWPDDLTLDQCRQCVDGYCVEACLFDALYVDETNGNVRAIDQEKCAGCGACVAACPYAPSRPVMAPDREAEGAVKSRKCDLCANAPFHFAEEGGGPNGKQACVEMCPIHAVVFTKKVPDQRGDAGYKVNLRDATWASLGFPKD